MATIGSSGKVGEIKGFSSRRVAAALREVAEDWAKLVRKNAPYDTKKQKGPETRATNKHLRDTIFVRTKGTTVEVVSTREYLAYLLEGTKKHRIDAVAAPVLSFYWKKAKTLSGLRKNNVLFRKKGGRKVLRFKSGQVALDHVNHKGAKANNFVKRLMPTLRRMIREKLRRKK